MFLKFPTTYGDRIINMDHIFTICPGPESDNPTTKLWSTDDSTCFNVSLPFETVEAMVLRLQK